MAILIDSPKGEGFMACEKGKPETSNPYQSIQDICKWYEWTEGWKRAFEMGKFGIKGEA
jgi:hypothetical protein